MSSKLNCIFSRINAKNIKDTNLLINASRRRLELLVIDRKRVNMENTTTKNKMKTSRRDLTIIQKKTIKYQQNSLLETQQRGFYSLINSEET